MVNSKATFIVLVLYTFNVNILCTHDNYINQEQVLKRLISDLEREVFKVSKNCDILVLGSTFHNILENRAKMSIDIEQLQVSERGINIY